MSEIDELLKTLRERKPEWLLHDVSPRGVTAHIIIRRDIAIGYSYVEYHIQPNAYGEPYVRDTSACDSNMDMNLVYIKATGLLMAIQVAEKLEALFAVAQSSRSYSSFDAANIKESGL